MTQNYTAYATTSVEAHAHLTKPKVLSDLILGKLLATNIFLSLLALQGKGFYVILSDMCPSVSGITTKDAALSYELGMQALSLAVGNSLLTALESSDDYLGANHPKCSDPDEDGNGILLQGGNLVIKLLESEDSQELGKICKSHFKKASWLRPKATRSSSREIYMVCQGLR